MAERILIPEGREIDAVVIGGSAGGLEAMLRILSGLPAAYRLPLIALLHLPGNGSSRLTDVFSGRLAIPVEEAIDKAHIAPGTLYIATGGYHLLVEQDRSFALSCDAPRLTATDRWPNSRSRLKPRPRTSASSRSNPS